jgi:hypothetical protein
VYDRSQKKSLYRTRHQYFSDQAGPGRFFETQIDDGQSRCAPTGSKKRPGPASKGLLRMWEKAFVFLSMNRNAWSGARYAFSGPLARSGSVS